MRFPKYCTSIVPWYFGDIVPVVVPAQTVWEFERITIFIYSELTDLWQSTIVQVLVSAKHLVGQVEPRLFRNDGPG